MTILALVLQETMTSTVQDPHHHQGATMETILIRLVLMMLLLPVTQIGERPQLIGLLPIHLPAPGPLLAPLLALVMISIVLRGKMIFFCVAFPFLLIFG